MNFETLFTIIGRLGLGVVAMGLLVGTSLAVSHLQTNPLIVLFVLMGIAVTYLLGWLIDTLIS